MSLKQFEIYNMKFKVGNKVLIDLFEEYLKSFFVHQSYYESLSRSKEIRGYVIINPKIEKIDGDEVLVGKFVKVLDINARQQLKDGKLIQSDKTMESAPSSIFFLRLFDHKLMYLREMPRAPIFKEFENIFRNFIYEKNRSLKKERQEELLAQYGVDSISALEEKKRSLISSKIAEEFPDLVIDFDSVTTKGTISNNLKKFSIIKNLSFTFKPRNDEELPDIDELSKYLEEMRKKSGKGTENVELETSIKAKDRNALDESQVKNILEGIDKLGGNATFEVNGRGAKGQKLMLHDRNCVAKPKVNYKVTDSLNDIAKKVFDVVKDYAEEKLINFAAIKNETSIKEKVKKIKL